MRMFVQAMAYDHGQRAAGSGQRALGNTPGLGRKPQ
jgi:hypothetical protein